MSRDLRGIAERCRRVGLGLFQVMVAAALRGDVRTARTSARLAKSLASCAAELERANEVLRRCADELAEGERLLDAALRGETAEATEI